MRIFKDIYGQRLDPIEHTLDILKKYPNVQIHIGSDSQNVGKSTKYATVIAFCVKPLFGNTKSSNQKSRIPELKRLKIVS